MRPVTRTKLRMGEKMQGITMILADFITRLTYDQIPSSALDQLKKCILDSIGCAFFGASTPWGRQVNEFVQSQEGVVEATLWTTSFRGPAANVVLGNGTMIHSFDFDDYHMTKIHPGAVVVPAALAIGEKDHVDGKRLLTAMTAGYETMVHISRAVNPGASRLKGWHLTGTCGTFAAAAAVGRLWGFDTDTMASALGMAGTQSAGLWAFTADGSYSKRFHPGRSSQSGIMAAALAGNGYRGPTKILEAEDGGFLRATSDDFNESLVIAGLGEKFDTEDVVIKPFAACGSLHSSVEALLRIRKDQALEPDQVERINVYNSDVVRVQCGFPYQPMGPLQAQMSLNYCMARSLLDGGLTLAQFTEDKLADPRAVDLSGRVHFISDDEINRIYPTRFPSIVEVVLTNGKRHKMRIDAQKGTPENPTTWEEVQTKFRTNSESLGDEQRLDAIIEKVTKLEDLSDAAELTKLLQG
jgi:2-methylcitrate dehydratase PrpD